MSSTLTAAEELLQSGTWQADAVHSRVEFAVEYMTGTFRGSFSPFEATLENGVLRGSAQVADVKVQDENLVAHLQTPDFFDAERTPAISFESSEISREGEQLRVAGTLTIRGATHPVELTGTIGEPIADPYGKERVGLRLEGRIDRAAFGINWNNPLPSGQPALANDVTLTAELYLVKS
jgi:polyisoprenoid-binding protein YceI